MDGDLASEEIRVLGALVEKSATTPDQYPLSINALVSACNQKSAREPVMALSEGDVRAAVDALTQRGLVRQANASGGRVSRFEHRLGDKPGTALRVSDEQLAVLAVLMLCGPQTPGQIRGRAQRLAGFANTDAVEAALAALADHDAGALVARLPRQPGKREHRWHHRLGRQDTAPETASQQEGPVTGARASAGDDGVAAGTSAGGETLEDRVAELERVVEQLREWIDDNGRR